MSLNSLGSFDFISLSGTPPDALKQRLEVHSRAGVDGVTVGRTGNRGDKFTVRSSVDCADRADARSTFGQYVDLIGDDPQDLVWWGLDLSEEGFQVVVLDVRPVTIGRTLNATGGLTDGGLGILVCDWDLLPVSTE